MCRSLWRVGLGAVLGSVLLVAFVSSSIAAVRGVSATPAGVTYATKQIARFSGPNQVLPRLSPFNAKADSGKTVWYIPIVATVPAETSIISILKDTLGRVGVKLQVCDSKGGDPVASNSCVTQAIAQHAGAIIDDSVNPVVIEANLKKARSAGIPVIIGNNNDPSEAMSPLGSAQVAYDYILGARLVADWVIADSKGHAHVLVVDTSSLSLRHAVVQLGYEHEFAHHCPGCTVTVKAVTSPADWGTKITPLVSAALTADRSIDYVVAPFDVQASFVSPAVTQLGMSNKVKIATYNADLQQMQTLAAGNQIGVDVGSNQDSISWAYADEALRLMAGKPGIKEVTGTRVFTRANVGKLKLDTKGYLSGAWYGPATYHRAYLKAWGLS